MIVVDTNVLVRLVFDAASASRNVLRLDPAWAAPLLWQSEFRSALAGMIRVSGLSPDEAARAFDQARSLVVLEPEPDTGAVLALVSASRCTAYDLEFVAVAVALNVPLITNDNQLLAEFPGAAISPEAFAA